MSSALILPRLSNTSHLSFNYTQIPKPIQSFPHRTSAALIHTSACSVAAEDSNVRTSNVGAENEEPSSSSSKPSSEGSSIIKAPTAPWMRGSLLVQSNKVLDLSKPRTKKKPASVKTLDPDKALTAKIGAGRGKKEMKMVLKGVKKLRAIKSSEAIREEQVDRKFEFPPGKMWWDGKYELDEKDMLFWGKNKMMGTGKGLEAKEFEFQLAEVEGEGNPKFSKQMPWDRNENWVSVRVKKEKVVTAAELILDKELLARLRDEASRIHEWVKVKKPGVTQAVVNQVHFIWKKNELAMIKFDLPLSRNMDRAQEIVEMKTGGLVVWRKKDALVVYRGRNYHLALQNLAKTRHPVIRKSENSSLDDYGDNTITVSDINPAEKNIAGMTTKKDDEQQENVLINGSLYEREADRLLDGLGPRFVDWWGSKPLPVDGDLLPEEVPGFVPPLRLCPSDARSQLTGDELTYLRKVARPLPTHFVLGRNRKLQGLATAILKLWEKCHIAKIAIKWGIPNTNNKQMAYELKCLTGGVLLLRNKFIIILYRGKNFLPPRVARLVSGRDRQLRTHQVREESARLRASENLLQSEIKSAKSSSSGTLSEYLTIQSEGLERGYGKSKVDIQLEAEKERLEKELRNQQRNHLILTKKIERSAKTLANLSSKWRLSERDIDQEMMTQEERECLRQIGLKMESSLVLGRRGIFNGVIESMHQHWKHREIVKVITFQRIFSQVVNTSKVLEAESGGILVSIEKLKEGHAVLIYRGKNYKRPKLVSSHLLSKRDALSRSLEMQRLGSLKYFANQRKKTISELKSKRAELTARMADQMNYETDDDELAETQ